MIFSIPVLLSIYSNLLVFSSFSLILKIYDLCCYCILGENVILMSYFNARLLIFLVFFLYFCFWFQTIDNAWPIFLNKRMALRKGEWISKNNKRNDKHFNNRSYSFFFLMDIFLKHLWLIPNILKWQDCKIFTKLVPSQTPSRSSHQRCSVKKGIFKNLQNFTGKHLCGVSVH